MNNFAILLAAGSGTRMESHDLPKCFISVNDKEIYQYSLETFLKMDQLRHVVLVVPFDYLDVISLRHKDDKKVSVISGGATRQESVFNALSYLKVMAEEDDNVLIHDAARPLVSNRIIIDNINTCSKYGACLTAIKSIDTIIKTFDFETVLEIPNRNILFSEQTPATFKFSYIYQAHEDAKNFNIIDASDDCTLILNNKHDIHLVNGDRSNFKITNEIDLALFKVILNNENKIN